MKQINIIGALLGISFLVTPLLGLRGDLYHLIYGTLTLFFALSYASLVISNRLPVPGLRKLEATTGRWGISTLMYVTVFATFLYAGYGLQNWLQASIHLY